MFGFLQDAGNYDSRKVGRWDNDGSDQMVSTRRVSDGRRPYETAFKHPEYNGGKMVIVEAYDAKGGAEAGHKKWVKVMTEGPLPDHLTDCCNAEIAQFADAMGSEFKFPRVQRA